MKEYLISDYIKKMSAQDIINFAKKKNINISYSEAMILYSYAKKHYKEFISDNPTNIIKELKEKLSPNTFKEAYKLYLEAKIKYLK